jgi:hypothetical protein
MNRLTLVAALAAATLSPGAGAASFCARNATELHQALQTAASNGQADDIRIARGTYVATTAQPFLYQSAESHGLTISGGWILLSGACVIPNNDASKTVLDGGNVVPALRIISFATVTPVPIAVQGLTVRYGRGTTSSLQPASGLAVQGYAESGHVISVDRVIAEGNYSTQDFQPAVSLVSDYGHITFTNSIVRESTTMNAAAVHVHANHGGSTLDHLTVYHNLRAGGLGGPMHWIGPAHLLQSSLVYGNTGWTSYDLATYANVEFRHNRYGVAADALTNGFENHAVIDPLTDDGLRPLPGSPLHSVGSRRLMAYDVYGRARLLGGYSDVGAAELVE